MREHSRRGAARNELVEVAFSHVGLSWEEHIVTDPSLIRPAEVDLLRADWSKAERELGITYTPVRVALGEAIGSYRVTRS